MGCDSTCSRCDKARADSSDPVISPQPETVREGESVSFDEQLPDEAAVVACLAPDPVSIDDVIEPHQTRPRLIRALRDYFRPIHISEAIRYRKPRPEAFLQTAEAMGVVPPDVLFIGDTFALDVVGAKRAGMDAAWFDRRGREITPAITLRRRRSAGSDSSGAAATSPAA